MSLCYLVRILFPVLVYNRGLKHVARLWPARCICGAREHLKNWKYYELWTNLAYSQSFSNSLLPCVSLFPLLTAALNSSLRPLVYSVVVVKTSDLYLQQVLFNVILTRLVVKLRKVYYWRFNGNSINIYTQRLFIIKLAKAPYLKGRGKGTN